MSMWHKHGMSDAVLIIPGNFALRVLSSVYVWRTWGNMGQETVPNPSDSHWESTVAKNG